MDGLTDQGTDQRTDGREDMRMHLKRRALSIISFFRGIQELKSEQLEILTCHRILSESKVRRR